MSTNDKFWTVTVRNEKDEVVQQFEARLFLETPDGLIEFGTEPLASLPLANPFEDE